LISQAFKSNRVREICLNGSQQSVKSALCAVKISAEYDTIAAQSFRWLQGDVEELQIRN